MNIATLFQDGKMGKGHVRNLLDTASRVAGGILRIADSDASHSLRLSTGSNLTADRTLNLNTGDADRTLTINGNATLPAGAVATKNGADAALTSIYIPVGDETTNITTGTAKVTFRMPFAMILAEIRASLATAQASGSIFTVDVNEDGVSLLSTKITIDNTEKTSTTAAALPVLSDTALASDAEITVDVDQVGTAGAKGLKVFLIGRPT